MLGMVREHRSENRPLTQDTIANPRRQHGLLCAIFWTIIIVALL